MSVICVLSRAVRDAYVSHAFSLLHHSYCAELNSLINQLNYDGELNTNVASN
jgi:hypothetical protein